MDRRRTCKCFCSCSNQTGLIFIASLYIVLSTLVFGVVLYFSTLVRLHELGLIVFLSSLCICAALGFVLLLGADKRNVGLARTFYVGVCILLVVRGLSVVYDLISGYPANLLGEGMALGLNLYFLSVVSSFVEEIKAEPQPRMVAAGVGVDEEDGEGTDCCCSLQTCTVFFGSTFIITSVPGAFWLVYTLSLPFTPTDARPSTPAVAAMVVLGLVFCVAFTLLGTWLLTGADRRSVARTRVGLYGIWTLLALRTVGLWLIFSTQEPVQVAVLETAIISLHVCALLIVRNFVAAVKAGSPDQGKGATTPSAEMQMMEDLNRADEANTNQAV